MRAIPHRQSWFAHQHFPAQTLLLESHDAFLAQGEQFSERLTRVISGEGLNARQKLRFAGRLEEEFRNWQWSMRCHETYEETRLYPFLAEQFAADCAPLATDHARLHELGAGCELALAKAARELSAGSPHSFSLAQQSLEEYRRALTQHLQEEEELVIPLLLSLSPGDFARYTGAESCGTPPGTESLLAHSR